MADVHGLGTTRPAADGTYSRKQIDAFQAEDRKAGRSVVLLMMAVFSLGLTGASIITWVVSH